MPIFAEHFFSMGLPINIDDLIHGNSVEWERLEFKRGWNPEAVMHSMCAFANDINNWGGGYIIIGVEEKNGQAVLPPVGIPASQIDKIQKELHELCHKILPNYFPVAQPVQFQGVLIFVIWIPGGETRPYKVPVSMAKKERQRSYYVRRFSKTVKPNPAEEHRLIQLAAKVPHDDRINHHAELSDLNLPLIRSFLKEVGSDLYPESGKIPFEQLCRQMQIVRGSKEFLKPVNVGLLFFNEHPEKFFRGAKIEVVIFHDDIGDNLTEKEFIGPLQTQIRDALSYIKNNVIAEEVIKVPNQAEAIRFYNYPYGAIEEALANAVYHRSYEHQSTIEISVRSGKIEILSFPGPLPPVGNKSLSQDRVIARNYRNRRIGDFLKELKLTEGRSTGIPKIRDAMKKNGSPKPTFKTDKDSTYFLTILPERLAKRKAAIKEFRVNQTTDLSLTSDMRKILKHCINPKSLTEIFRMLNISNQTKNYRSKMLPLLEKKYLLMTIPDAPKNPHQKYLTSDSGKEEIKHITSAKRT